MARYYRSILLTAVFAMYVGAIGQRKLIKDVNQFAGGLVESHIFGIVHQQSMSFHESPNTLITPTFPIGDITQSFTAIATMMALNGTIKLDSPLRVALRNNIKMHTKALTDEISFRDILSHRTGLSSCDTIMDWFGNYVKFSKEIIRMIPITNPFRTVYLANKVLYAVVDAALNTVGRPLKLHLATFIENIGLQSTKGIDRDILSEAKKRKLFKQMDIIRLNHVKQASGLWSNGEDLNRFVNYILKGAGKIKGRGRTISKGDLRELLNPAVLMPRYLSGIKHDRVLSFASGFKIGIFLGYPKIQMDSGKIGRFSCSIYVLQEQEIAAWSCVLRNKTDNSKIDWSQPVVRYILNKHMDEKDAFYSGSKEAEDEVESEIKILRKYPSYQYNLPFKFINTSDKKVIGVYKNKYGERFTFGVNNIIIGNIYILTLKQKINKWQPSVENKYEKLKLMNGNKVKFIVQFVKKDFSAFEIILGYTSRGLLYKKVKNNN